MCKFHKGLPDAYSKNIPSSLRGICLESQLYGRLKDFCKGITPKDLASEDVIYKILEALYQLDPISVVSEVFKDFINLISTGRPQNESFRNFESLFAAQLSNFYAIGDSIKLHESITALLLLNNAEGDDSQRISIISSVASNIDDQEFDIDAELEQ